MNRVKIHEALRLLLNDRRKWASRETYKEPSEDSHRARVLLEDVVEDWGNEGSVARELYCVPNIDAFERMVKSEIAVEGPRDFLGYTLQAIKEIDASRYWVARFYSFLELYLEDFTEKCKEGKDRVDMELLMTFRKKSKVIEDLRHVLSHVARECEQAEMRTMVKLGELLPQTTDRPHDDERESNGDTKQPEPPLAVTLLCRITDLIKKYDEAEAAEGSEIDLAVSLDAVKRDLADLIDLNKKRVGRGEGDARGH